MIEDNRKERMSNEDKKDARVAGVVFAIILAILIYALFGCTKPTTDARSTAPDPEPSSTVAEMEISEEAPHDLSKFAWVAEKLEQAKMEQAAATEEPEVEEYYDDYVEYYYIDYGYQGGGVTGYDATTLDDLLSWQGRTKNEDGSRSYTWYPYDFGNGPIDHRVPGCHYDESGVAYDEDGYIVVAVDSSQYDQGDVIDTPYGEAKAYDTGAGYNNIDVYTNKDPIY